MYNFRPTLIYKDGENRITSVNTENKDYSLEISVDEGSVRCVLHPKKTAHSCFVPP